MRVCKRQPLSMRRHVEQLGVLDSVCELLRRRDEQQAAGLAAEWRRGRPNQHRKIELRVLDARTYARVRRANECTSNARAPPPLRQQQQKQQRRGHLGSESSCGAAVRRHPPRRRRPALPTRPLRRLHHRRPQCSARHVQRRPTPAWAASGAPTRRRRPRRRRPRHHHRPPRRQHSRPPQPAAQIHCCAAMMAAALALPPCAHQRPKRRGAAAAPKA